MTIRIARLPSFGVSRPLSFLADSNFSFFKFFLIKNYLLLILCTWVHEYSRMHATVCSRSSEDSTGQWVLTFHLVGAAVYSSLLGPRTSGGSFVSATRFEVGVQALQIPASTLSFLNGRHRPLSSGLRLAHTGPLSAEPSPRSLIAIFLTTGNKRVKNSPIQFSGKNTVHKGLKFGINCKLAYSCLGVWNCLPLLAL